MAEIVLQLKTETMQVIFSKRKAMDAMICVGKNNNGNTETFSQE